MTLDRGQQYFVQAGGCFKGAYICVWATCNLLCMPGSGPYRSCSAPCARIRVLGPCATHAWLHVLRSRPWDHHQPPHIGIKAPVPCTTAQLIASAHAGIGALGPRVPGHGPQNPVLPLRGSVRWDQGHRTLCHLYQDPCAGIGPWGPLPPLPSPVCQDHGPGTLCHLCWALCIGIGSPTALCTRSSMQGHIYNVLSAGFGPYAGGR